MAKCSVCGRRSVTYRYYTPKSFSDTGYNLQGWKPRAFCYRCYTEHAEAVNRIYLRIKEVRE